MNLTNETIGKMASCANQELIRLVIDPGTSVSGHPLQFVKS